MKTIIILSAILFALAGAKHSNADNVPKDFRVTLNDGGGMSREGKEYFLSIDSSYAIMHESDATTKVYFKSSMDDLKRLYNIILQYDFHAVETYEEMVYDRGGTTISVTADGEYYQKVDGGMTFIVESWRDEFEKVESEIRSIVAKHLDKMLREVTVKFDDSFMDEDKIVNFNIGDYVYMSARDGWQSSVTVTLIPGEHYGYFTMMNKELTTEPGAKIFAQGQGVIRVAEDTDTIYVYREGKEIMWK
jgi:hypothetical protein